MTRLVKCLPCKHKNTSPILEPHQKKWKASLGEHICNRSTREAETGTSLGLVASQPRPPSKFQTNETLCLRKERWAESAE